MHAIANTARGALRLVRSVEARQNAIAEWGRRLSGEPELPRGPIRSVLVICQGNLCRSPFAGKLLASTLPDVTVRSGGLLAAEGEPADPRAIEVARRFGVDLVPHRTHRVTTTDLEETDLLLVMQGWHAAAVRSTAHGASARLRLLGHYLASRPYELADPWGRSAEDFQACFGRIEAASARLAELLAPPNHATLEQRS
jgi:protein-tyrosine phosphatase